MNATAYFIKDRALSLSYEAIRFPETAETVLAWLRRASDWSKTHRRDGLARIINTRIAHIVSSKRA